MLKTGLVSSRLQISYIFNCCHDQIYLSKQISLEPLTMEMCVCTEVKTICHVQGSTGDTVTKKRSTTNEDFLSRDFVFLK